MASCRFGEDTERGTYCERFGSVCDGDQCEYNIPYGEFSDEETVIMRDMCK